MHVRVNGTELFYAEHGAGRPLAALHGGLGFDHTYLRPGLDPLGDRARLVYLDLRGCGRSARPDDWREVDHATWVADVDAIRAHLGLERWLIFGHSYGGILALEYALRFPERVAGLIVCGASPAFDHAEASFALVQPRATPEQMEVVARDFAAPFASDEAMEATFRAVIPLYFDAPTPARCAAATDGLSYSAGAFNRSFFECLPAFDVRARLDEIEAPTLVIDGEYDWFFPTEYGAEALRDGLPNAELALFEACGHLPFIEQPERFCEAVTQWLDALPD